MGETMSLTLETTPAPSRREGRQWLGLVILLLPMLLVMLDLSVIFLAIPYMIADLKLSSLEALWVIDIYGFFVVGFLVTIGRLGDRIGHRRLLFIGAAAFCVLSLIAAFATGPVVLIAVRALLGVAGATIGPCVMALIKNLFPDPKQMATAFSMLTTVAMLGVLLGPTVGGLLLGSFWWGSTFLIAVPVMALLLLVGPFVLPRDTRDHSSEPLDLVSVVLSLAAMLPVIWGLTALARSFSLTPVLAIVIGVACGVLFVRRQRRLRDPLLDMRLFGIRAVGATLLMYLLTGIVQSGNGLVLNQHLQLVEGYTAFQTALWMALPVGAAIGGVHVSTMLAKRFRPGLVLIGGLLVAAAGEAVLSRISPVNGLVTLLVGLCVVMIGTSPVGTLSNQLVMQAAPDERAGSAGSLSGASGEFGSALGVAVFGSLVTVFYGGHVAVPAGTPDDVATAANDSLPHALESAAGLPADLGAQLTTAARASYTLAVDHLAGLSVLLFLGLAVLVHVSLRSVRPIGSEETEPETDPETDPDPESLRPVGVGSRETE
jgi:DHA2 family multidrug resistance protein-like MFS transporter